MLFNIDFRNATIDDLIALFDAVGYVNSQEDFKLAKEQDLFKYIGTTGGYARYLVGFYNEDEDAYYATVASVRIGPGSGGFDVDWAGCPSFEHKEMEEVAKYIENRCN